MESKRFIKYGLIGLSILLGLVVRTGALDPIEAPLIIALQQAILSINLMWFFQAFNHLGDSIVWISLALLLLAYDYGRPRVALKLFLLISVVAVVVIVYRLIFPRVRPFDEFASKIQDFAFEGLPSYPSGHVAPTAGGFYLLANHRPKLNAIFAVMVAMLGISRVATGTHYPTDVIGALLFSYPLATIIDDLKIFKRFKDS